MRRRATWRENFWRKKHLATESKTAAGSAAVDVPPATESFRGVNEKSTSVCVVHARCVYPVNSSRNTFRRVDRIRSHQVRRRVCSVLYPALYFLSLSPFFFFSFSLSAATTKGIIYPTEDLPCLSSFSQSAGRQPTFRERSVWCLCSTQLVNSVRSDENGEIDLTISITDTLTFYFTSDIIDVGGTINFEKWKR